MNISPELTAATADELEEARETAYRSIYRIDQLLQSSIGHRIRFMHASKYIQEGVLLGRSDDLIPRLRVLNVHTGTIRWITLYQMVSAYWRRS